MWIVSGVLAVIALWEWSHIRFLNRKIVNLVSYTAEVLLDDGMRQDQAAKFRGFIQGINGDAPAVSTQATYALGELADRLAAAPTGSSILGAHSMIWGVKQGKR